MLLLRIHMHTEYIHTHNIAHLYSFIALLGVFRVCVCPFGLLVFILAEMLNYNESQFNTHAHAYFRCNHILMALKEMLLLRGVGFATNFFDPLQIDCE